MEETLAGERSGRCLGVPAVLRSNRQEKAYALALSIARTPQAAEDVVIDSLPARLAQCRHLRRTAGKVLAWLLTICRNFAISAIPRTNTVAAERTLLEEKSGHDASDVLAAFEEHSVVRATTTELHPIEQELLAFFPRSLTCGKLAHAAGHRDDTYAGQSSS